MQKPNLERMWETFIKFSFDDLQSGKHFSLIREKVGSTISLLQSQGIIGWYCFLVHDRNSGVPTSSDDRNPYFHIRFELEKDVDLADILPSYCVLTRKIGAERVKAISIDSKGTKFDTALLKEESIEEVWRLIGEQSEWLLNLLNAFKDDVNIPLNCVGQFLHYYSNMTCLMVK